MTFRSGTDFGNSTLVATSDPFYVVANASESSSVVASLGLSTATSSPLNTATSSTSYTATSSTSNAATPPTNRPSGLAAGTKAGIAVAVVVLLLVSTGIAFWFLTKHRSRRRAVPLVGTTGPEKGILQGLFLKPELDGTGLVEISGEQSQIGELDDTDIKGGRPPQSQIFELDIAAAESTKGYPNAEIPGPQDQR